MLGRLAKWLRVMGRDTLYRSRFRAGEMEDLLSGDRILLTRRVRTHRQFPGSVLLQGNHTSEQLRELRDQGLLPSERSRWFTRCLVCNTPLERADPEKARTRVPEYVYSEHGGTMRYCPSCDRYYWSGTHRERMLTQLKRWGLPFEAGEG
jgi:hypothetical protein